MGVIETNALTRRYGSRRGIERIDLAVPAGTLFGLLGPNGAGKTTAIRVLMGFLRPTSGSATIFGMDCWRAGPRIRAEVGYIPGDLRLYPWMDGASALRVFGSIRGRDLRAPGKALAEEFELDLSVKVRSMSRGTRQKLGLVLALAHEPKLLILDEPTTTLDPLMQDRVREKLRSAAAAGRTVLFSSHTLSEVEMLCDRVAIVRDGAIVAHETLDALRARAGHEVTIRWRDDAAAPPDAPAFLHVRARESRTWRATLDGPVDALIAWLASLPSGTVADLTISPPDLDSLFRRFYLSPTPPPDAKGAR